MPATRQPRRSGSGCPRIGWMARIPPSLHAEERDTAASVWTARHGTARWTEDEMTRQAITPVHTHMHACCSLLSLPPHARPDLPRPGQVRGPLCMCTHTQWASRHTPPLPPIGPAHPHHCRSAGTTATPQPSEREQPARVSRRPGLSPSPRGGRSCRCVSACHRLIPETSQREIT